jgi:protein-tyrosine phosphatase
MSFPFFNAAFLSRDEEVDIQPLGDGQPRPQVLRTLDLDGLDRNVNLSRDDAPVTEIRARKAKMRASETRCSQLAPGLFVGGEVVAKSRSILLESNISHVINCVGQLYDSYFDELEYLKLYLNDSPNEDLLAVLYDSFTFIENAHKDDGNVFLHCSQGVSRSMSLAIAYRMWKEGRNYEDIFTEAKQLRPVANPNIGFVFQLMQWWKRRRDSSLSANIYRITPQSEMAPNYLVPKWINSGLDDKDDANLSLDPRGAFVLHKGDRAFIWTGSEIVSDAFALAARRFVTQLERYEREEDSRPMDVVYVEQGNEDETLLSWLDSCHVSRQPRRCSSFDADFELWTRHPNASQSTCDTCDTCDSSKSRKTPRRESTDCNAGACASSPNDRRRRKPRKDETA